MNEPILIVGTGALATLFAARLTAAGVNVTMLGTWKNGIESLARDGARLVDAKGITHGYPVRATSDPSACRDAKFALVLVKSWQTERVARQLAECLAPDGLALTLQNGLGNDSILANRLRVERVALGVTTTGATLLGPGLARLGGEGIVSIQNHARLSPLESTLRTAGFNVNVVNDARTLAWSKVVINAAINPLTALLRVPNGALLERPAARDVMRLLAKEAADVATAQGITLGFDDPAGAAEDVARQTANNYSSMFQDVRRGAPTEIDAICGAVVQAGMALGLKTSVNWTMWKLVRATVAA